MLDITLTPATAVAGVSGFTIEVEGASGEGDAFRVYVNGVEASQGLTFPARDWAAGVYAIEVDYVASADPDYVLDAGIASYSVTSSSPSDPDPGPGDTGSNGNGGGGGVSFPDRNDGYEDGYEGGFSLGSIPLDRGRSGIYLITEQGIDSSGELRGGSIVVDSRPGEVALATMPGPIKLVLTGGIAPDPEATSFQRDVLLKRDRIVYESRFNDLRFWDYRRGPGETRFLLCRRDVPVEINPKARTTHTGGTWSMTLIGHEGSWQGDNWATQTISGDGQHDLDAWAGCTAPMHDLYFSVTGATSSLKFFTPLTRLELSGFSGHGVIDAAGGRIDSDGFDTRNAQAYSENGWGSFIVINAVAPTEVPSLVVEGLGGGSITIAGPRRWS